MNKILFLGTRKLGGEALSFLKSQKDIEVETDSGDDSFLAAKKYDLIVSVNHDKIIREPLLSSARLGAVNLHHSHNLRIRGRHCATHAILLARQTGVWEHGSTLHYMNAELDAGKVIKTLSCPVYENDTAFTLFNRCEVLGLSLIQNSLPNIWRGEIKTTNPSEEFYTFRQKDLPSKEIDLSLPPLQVYDLVRSLTFPPFDPPYTIIKGEKKTLSIDSGILILNAGKDRLVYG